MSHSLSYFPGQKARGREAIIAERTRAVKLWLEARADGADWDASARALGYHPSTLSRWHHRGVEWDLAARPMSEIHAEKRLRLVREELDAAVAATPLPSKPKRHQYRQRQPEPIAKVVAATRELQDAAIARWRAEWRETQRRAVVGRYGVRHAR